MNRATASALFLLLVWGCGGQAEKTMGGGEAFIYPELETFDQEAFLGIAYPAARGNWAEVKKFVSSDKYKAAVDKFQAAPLPAGFTDRQAAKDGLIAAAKSMQEKAAGASNSEVEAGYKALLAAKGALMQTGEPTK